MWDNANISLKNKLKTPFYNKKHSEIKNSCLFLSKFAQEYRLRTKCHSKLIAISPLIHICISQSVQNWQPYLAKFINNDGKCFDNEAFPYKYILDGFNVQIFLNNGGQFYFFFLSSNVG